MKSTLQRKEFATLLSAWRKQRQQKIQDLEAASGVPNPTISMFENAKKSCGQALAIKLADGLRLNGNERLQFLTAAEGTIERVSQGFPSALTDSLFDILRCAGIDKRKVVKVLRENAAGSQKSDLIVELDSGERYAIDFKVEKLQ